MKYIDLHCDTLMQAYFAGKDDIFELENTMLDVKRLQSGKNMAQFFAIFMPPISYIEDADKKYPGDEAYIQYLYQILINTTKKFPDTISLAKYYNDLIKNNRTGKISAFLTLEDGRAVDGSIENLERYYEMGIRLISLTWNSKNCFGSPNSTDPIIMNQGLTDFGKEAVVRMQELGMLVDVSHLSDGGFWDVKSLCKTPFVASHSNCRSLCSHQRNLTDEMIYALAESGGVIGLNFYPDFLSENNEDRISRIKDMVRHLEHLVKYGGEDCVSIGTDFDGMSGTFEIDSPDKMYLLFDELHKNHFSDDLIDKIAYKNARRVIQDVIR